ncbi:MAG: LacI family DNA-binding transcriptional regulator, partial [Fibrobacteres bacterium]|nr:LacI family DNA-binding transcriptional regulator [Fibrobacterota bacterium]
MPISLSMVASRAGTSKAAVSRAFSGSSEISEETRQRIFKIAAELGYIHNASRSQHARLIRSQNDSSVPPAERTNLVTLLFYKTNRAHVYNVPYYQELIGQLDKTFRSEGMNIIEAYPQNEKEYSRIMKTASTDALILLSNIEYLTDEFISLLRLYAAHKPLVFLSNYIGKYKNEFHSVRADDFGVGTNGAEYCCENNNGEVVFVDSGLGMAVVEDRFLGYKTVMYRENRQ